MTLMFLNGTAMAGQKDFATHNGSAFLGPARTTARYRFFVVRDEFPGLLAVEQDGRVIEGELYDIPEGILRSRLLPAEPAELELGTVELIGGESVYGMCLVPSRLDASTKVVDISELGGFRAYQRHLAANQSLDQVLGRVRPDA
jgi:Allophanate hydrolase C-terminal domain